MMDLRLVLIAVFLAVSLDQTSANQPNVRYLADYLNFGQVTKEFREQVLWINDKIERQVSNGSPENVRLHIQLSTSLAEKVATGDKSVNKAKDILGVMEYDREQLDDLWDILDTLLDLSNLRHKRLDCSAYRVHRYFNIYRILLYAKDSKGRLSGGGKLMRYVKHYGQQRLKLCLAHLERWTHKVSKNDDFLKAERKLDHVISLGKEEIANNTIKLTNQAESIDISRKQYNIDEMSKFVALTFGASEDGLSEIENFNSFIKNTCEEFRSQVEQICDNYNLARLFTPQTIQTLNLRPRFGKMNEYSRICLSALHPPQTDPAGTELAGQIDGQTKPNGFASFLGKCFGMECKSSN